MKEISIHPFEVDDARINVVTIGSRILMFKTEIDILAFLNKSSISVSFTKSVCEVIFRNWDARTEDRRGQTEGIIIQVVCDCYTSARGDFKNFVLDITVKCNICDGRRRSRLKDR